MYSASQKPSLRHRLKETERRMMILIVTYISFE